MLISHIISYSVMTLWVLNLPIADLRLGQIQEVHPFLFGEFISDSIFFLVCCTCTNQTCISHVLVAMYSGMIHLG